MGRQLPDDGDVWKWVYFPESDILAEMSSSPRYLYTPSLRLQGEAILRRWFQRGVFQGFSGKVYFGDTGPSGHRTLVLLEHLAPEVRDRCIELIVSIKTLRPEPLPDYV